MPSSDIQKTHIDDSINSSQDLSTLKAGKVDKALAIFNEVEQHGEVLI
jgi:hypothetical protein